jgi:hypothetical protein
VENIHGNPEKEIFATCRIQFKSMKPGAKKASRGAGLRYPLRAKKGLLFDSMDGPPAGV